METSGSEQRKASILVSSEAAAPVVPGASLPWSAHTHWLFISSVAIRGMLALVLFLCAVYVLDLLHISDSFGWLVLGLTTAAVAWVLLDEAYDVEGALAREVAAAAAFDPDPYGARAEAVRAYSDDFVRTRGRVPRGRARLRQPDNNHYFRAYFLSRGPEYRRWCARVLLMSAQRALRVIAAGLLAVIAAQAYILLVG